jgi:hypothetical protein
MGAANLLFILMNNVNGLWLLTCRCKGWHKIRAALEQHRYIRNQKSADQIEGQFSDFVSRNVP